MNILVVNLANKYYTNKSILAEPIDVLQIATIICEKYSDVRVIDMDGKRLENDLNPYLEEENIVVFVYDYQLPLHTYLAVENIKEIIRSCKQKTKFIMIGKSQNIAKYMVNLIYPETKEVSYNEEAGYQKSIKRF